MARLADFAVFADGRAPQRSRILLGLLDLAGVSPCTIGMPDRVRFCRRAASQNERLRAFSAPRRDLRHRSLRRDRAILREDAVVVAGLGAFVAVLDQKPIGALVAGAVVLDAHENPTAFELISGENEFEFALAQLLFRALVAHRRPETAIPNHHGAAAVLTFGNGAFEVAVVERMIFDFNGEALDLRIDGRTLGDGPGFEYAIEFETKIVMQSRCVVLLDYEAQMLRRPDESGPTRFGGFREVALGAIFGKLSACHLLRSASLRRPTKFNHPPRVRPAPKQVKKAY